MNPKHLVLNAILCASLALGQVAVMSRPLVATAQVNPDWDRSSLSFVGSCTLQCQQQLSATVCNVGSGGMDGPTSWELYFSTSGNPKNGTVVATGEVPAMASTDPDTCHTLTYTVTQDGNYMFRVLQRPGHPGQGELWSTACANGCVSPTPTASPSPSVDPSPSATPSASPTVSPSASPSASPAASASPSATLQVVSSPTPDPSPSATPTANPSPSADPSPTPSSNSSSSNSNSSSDSSNGVGGGNSGSSSNTSSNSERGRGQVLGATTLADTGDSDIQLAMVVLMAGAFITFTGAAYVYKVS